MEDADSDAEANLNFIVDHIMGRSYMQDMHIVMPFAVYFSFMASRGRRRKSLDN